MSLFSRLFKRDDAPEGEAAGTPEAQASDKQGAEPTSRAAGERKAAPASKAAQAQAPASSNKEARAAQTANEPPPLRKSATENASAAQPTAASSDAKGAAPPPLKTSAAGDKQPAASAATAAKAAAPSAQERAPSNERATSQAVHKGQTMLGMPVASMPAARTSAEAEKPAASKAAQAKPVVSDTDKTLPMRTDTSDPKARAKADAKVTITDSDKARASAQAAPVQAAPVQAAPAKVVAEPTKARAPAEAQAQPKPAATSTIEASPNKPAAQPTAEALAQSARETFRREAPQALAPFMELLVELYASQTLHREWMARAQAGLKALSTHAEKLEDAGLREMLEEAQAVLKKAEQAGAGPVDEALSAELSRSYERLRARVPEAQDPRRELARRDDVLVEALLLSVEGMHPHALSRVRAAGWDKSARFVQRTPEALMHETGLELALCQGICAAFARFHEEFPGMVPAPTRARELSRLATLVDTLRAQQARFEQAAAGFTDQDLSQRRALRAERLYTTRQISAILSRLGEVERVTLLDRAPYAQKIAHLTEFLRDARAPQAALS